MPIMKPFESGSQFLASAQLLFGMVALQMNFVSREQLVAAFDSWVNDKSRPLAEFLSEQGNLSPDDRQLLERLTAKFLEKHGGDAEQSLAALPQLAEMRPALERLHDADLAASLGHMRQVGAGDSDDGATMMVPSGPPAGRFRILRLHAKGGLGQVSVALDQDLNREVALKEIQPQHADNLLSRERFLLEAEITGGLEHPGIVPVYALGHRPDGRPYYAMRLIRGESLKATIEAYHRPDNPNRRDESARQVETRRLLGRFIDVCNAMDYAHSRGVLHRDLKPGNIMLGKHGETLVVDWGLAKAVGKKEVFSDEATLAPTSAISSSGHTQPGSAVGTPAYMSPEQAAGTLDKLGPSSDVYSLGATLYHILCGRPPFEKENLDDLLVKVQKGQFPKPRSIVPAIPRGLEAICLKAMSIAPLDRYQTSRALADDLERWLADEPIVASPDTLNERVNRFARKHRSSLLTAGMVVVVSLTALLLINDQRHESNRLRMEKEDALEDAEHARALERLAMENSRLAQSHEAQSIRHSGLAREFEERAKAGEAENAFLHFVGSLSLNDRAQALAAWERLYKLSKDVEESRLVRNLAIAFVAGSAQPELSQEFVQVSEQSGVSWLLGAAQVRHGDYERGIASLTNPVPPPAPPGLPPGAPRPAAPPGWNNLFIALAKLKQGKREEALAAYQSAETQIASANATAAWGVWYERVAVSVLQREVAGALKVEIRHSPHVSDNPAR
jgi:serine/threonine protein kinase